MTTCIAVSLFDRCLVLALVPYYLLSFYASCFAWSGRYDTKNCLYDYILNFTCFKNDRKGVGPTPGTET